MQLSTTQIYELELFGIILSKFCVKLSGTVKTSIRIRQKL